MLHSGNPPAQGESLRLTRCQRSFLAWISRLHAEAIMTAPCSPRPGSVVEVGLHSVLSLSSSTTIRARLAVAGRQRQPRDAFRRSRAAPSQKGRVGSALPKKSHRSSSSIWVRVRPTFLKRMALKAVIAMGRLSPNKHPKL